MITGKCCICGTVKNCGPFLERVFKNIETIAKQFSDYQIIMAYDDSSDNSLQLLQEFIQVYTNKFILHINIEPLSQYRVYNIAKARNKCLDIIRSQFPDYEYFIMIDCDDVCAAPIKIEYLLYYLTVNTDWDALSFNKKPYYDLWALSKYPYSFSCMHFKYGSQRINKFINGFYDFKPRPDLLPPHLLKANEKICGPVFLKGKAGLIDCEHRSFHLMALGARIRIAPEIIF